MNHLMQPDAFALEGDMQAVAQMLTPDIADNLAAEDMPSLSGEATSYGYTVTARLPGTARRFSLLPFVTDISYNVLDATRGDSPRARHTGWGLNMAIAHVTRLKQARYSSINVNTPPRPDAAVLGITWALGQLSKRSLPEGVSWNT